MPLQGEGRAVNFSVASPLLELLPQPLLLPPPQLLLLEDWLVDDCTQSLQEGASTPCPGSPMISPALPEGGGNGPERLRSSVRGRISKVRILGWHRGLVRNVGLRMNPIPCPDPVVKNVRVLRGFHLLETVPELKGAGLHSERSARKGRYPQRLRIVRAQGQGVIGGPQGHRSIACLIRRSGKGQLDVGVARPQTRCNGKRFSGRIVLALLDLKQAEMPGSKPVIRIEFQGQPVSCFRKLRNGLAICPGHLAVRQAIEKMQIRVGGGKGQGPVELCICLLRVAGGEQRHALFRAGLNRRFRLTPH